MTINIYFVSSEMIAEIEKVNRIQQSSGLILGSADLLGAFSITRRCFLHYTGAFAIIRAAFTIYIRGAFAIIRSGSSIIRGAFKICVYINEYNAASECAKQ